MPICSSLPPGSDISAPDDRLSVSSTFYLGSHTCSDIIFRSMDSVLFYVSSDMLAIASSTAFRAQISKSRARLDAIDIPDNSDVLNIILCVLYNVTCRGHAPSFNVLEKAIDRMTVYDIIPKAHLLPSNHIHALLLSFASEEPLMVYALAARHGLDDLATSTSAHLLSLSLYDITDDLSNRMGPIYLKRLMNLLMQRTELLRRLLIQPPNPHLPTRNCGFPEQKKLSGGWTMVAASLSWSAGPDVATSTIESAFSVLGVTCERCRVCLEARIKDVLMRWSSAKRTI